MTETERLASRIGALEILIGTLVARLVDSEAAREMHAEMIESIATSPLSPEMRERVQSYLDQAFGSAEQSRRKRRGP